MELEAWSEVQFGILTRKDFSSSYYVFVEIFIIPPNLLVFFLKKLLLRIK